MSQPVKVTILDREYLVACPDEQRASLLASADLLNSRMREIRDSGKVVGLERIAVMAALNITHELMEARSGCDDAEDASRRLQRLDARLAAALDEFDEVAAGVDGRRRRGA